jgi:hypothetical protein
MSTIQFYALGLIWVGGWGFLFFAHPAAMCRLARIEATPSRLRRIRNIGAIELAGVYLSAVAVFIAGFYTTYPC